MRFFVFIGFLLFSFGSLASDWENGVKAVKDEAYEKALVSFSKLEKSGEESPALFYNMALCYHSISSNGKATAYYLKALKLNPNQDEALVQLKKINKELNPLKELNHPSIYLKNRNSWFYFFLITALIAGTLFIINRVRLRSLGIALLAITFTGISLVCYFFSYKQYHYNSSNQLAVTAEVPQELLTAPTENGSVLEEIPSGTILKFVEKKDNWFRVVWKGKKAWIKSKNVILV
jgi:tetratricopeptide (TPR) repeat protein